MLTNRDYRAILDLIAITYETRDRVLTFQLFFENLHQLVPMTSAAYAPVETTNVEFQFPGSVIYNSPIEPLYLFTQYYAAVHPYYTAVAKNGLGQRLNLATNLTDLIPPVRLRNSEYGTVFQPKAQVFYESCVMLGAQGDVLGTMGLHRGRRERDFTIRERQIVGQVLPHLARSLQLFGLTEGMHCAEEVGELVLEEDGRALSINDAAKRMLGTRSPCEVPSPRSNLRPTLFSTDTGVYRVRKINHYPQPKRATLFLTPMPPRHYLTPRLANMGLSKRQIEIAVLAIQGYSNGAIADRLCIGEQTVKDHLYDVFQCLRIRRRTQLSSAILSIQP